MVRAFLVDQKWVIVKAAAYVVVVISFYVVFLWFLFPYNALTTRLVERLRSRSLDVSVGSTTGAFPLGLKFHHVVVKKESGGSEKDLLAADEIELIPGILSIFRGWLSLSIMARLYHGSILFNIGLHKRDFACNGVIKDIDIGMYPVLRSSYGLNMIGKLNARLNIKGSMDNVAKDAGKGVMDMKAVALEPSNLLGILPLPKIDFGDITLPVYIKDGRIDVQDASQTSKDINSQLDGSIMLMTPAGNSTLDLRLKFNPTPALEAQIRKTVPLFMLTRAPSGYFNMHITGNVSMPRFNQ